MIETATTPASNGDAPAIVQGAPSVPDFLGVAGRVKSVSTLIEAAQEQREGLRAQRLLNGHQPEDAIPGLDPQVTYAERFGQLEDGIAALAADNQDIHDELVAEALKRRRKREQES